MSLKLNLNEPLELTLTRPDPKRYRNEGRPDSFMYSVTVLPEGRAEKLFLPQAASESLEALQIPTGERFTVCRRKTQAGIEYFDLHTSATEARATTTPRPMAQAATATAVPANLAASSRMSACLAAAIEAATEAQQFAASKGVAIHFSNEDIRAIANTLYIEGSKQDARAYHAA